MKNSINLIVVDNNEEVTSSIKRYFSSQNDVKVLAAINDGMEALSFIVNHEKEIDVILLDIIIPKMDGLALLENLRNRKINKKVIVLTSYKDEMTVRKLNNYGISYYMIKPFDLSSLEKRIVELFKSYDSSSNAAINTEIKISEILHNLGIPSHVRGYQYIRDGILLIYNNNKSISYITKEVYPEIAMKYDTTASRVERAIRHAIEISWDRGDLDLMEDLFGHSIQYERSKPTNSEFINTIADHVKLSNKLVVH